MQQGIPEHDLSARCLLALIEPERGSTVTPEQVAPLLHQQFPAIRIIGRLPRAVRQISTADEYIERYVSPIDVDPGGRLAQATHQMVERLCLTIGLNPPVSLPRSPWWARWRRAPAWPASPGRLVPERE